MPLAPFPSRSITAQVRAALDEHDGDLPAPDMVLRLRVPDDHSVFKLGSKFGAEPLQVRVSFLIYACK